MFSKKLAVLAAASLMTVSTAAAAQSPAQALSPAASLSRAGADVEGNDLAGSGFWVAVIGVALVAGIVLAFTNDDDDVDLPTSP